MDSMARVLVVDDAAFIRRWCRDVLVDKGYEVVEAEDGQKGIDAYMTSLPDVVLLDVNMHPVDGLTALRELRRLDGAARVLMLTSDGEIDVVVQARRLGAVGYILKPCASDRLIASIEGVLGAGG
jgi:two-component system chemotaxis response regulator CheY